MPQTQVAPVHPAVAAALVNSAYQPEQPIALLPAYAQSLQPQATTYQPEQSRLARIAQGIGNVVAHPGQAAIDAVHAIRDAYNNSNRRQGTMWADSIATSISNRLEDGRLTNRASILDYAATQIMNVPAPFRDYAKTEIENRYQFSLEEAITPQTTAQAIRQGAADAVEQVLFNPAAMTLYQYGISAIAGSKYTPGHEAIGAVAGVATTAALNATTAAAYRVSPNAGRYAKAIQSIVFTAMVAHTSPELGIVAGIGELADHGGDLLLQNGYTQAALLTKGAASAGKIGTLGAMGVNMIDGGAIAGGLDTMALSKAAYGVATGATILTLAKLAEKYKKAADGSTVLLGAGALMFGFGGMPLLGTTETVKDTGLDAKVDTTTCNLELVTRTYHWGRFMMMNLATIFPEWTDSWIRVQPGCAFENGAYTRVGGHVYYAIIGGDANAIQALNPNAKLVTAVDFNADGVPDPAFDLEAGKNTGTVLKTVKLPVPGEDLGVRHTVKLSVDVALSSPSGTTTTDDKDDNSGSGGGGGCEIGCGGGGNE